MFTASQAGDLKRVRNLQKLMLRSRANTLVSVRRVTEIKAGRKTAGIDGQVVLTSSGKTELALLAAQQAQIRVHGNRAVIDLHRQHRGPCR
ncbi:reverse transcriptase N-terminal domain-containing protein [Streptomyces sp. NPDC001177]